MNSSLCSPWSLCALCFIFCGCHSPSGAGQRPEPQPFVETVPGSTVTFTMRPVLVEQGGVLCPLWFAETETTWDAYDVFYLRLDEATGGDIAAAGREGPDAITRPTLPYAPPDRGWGHGGYPAIGVTFHAATKYCEWLSANTGRRYRLPTEAEFGLALTGSCDVTLARTSPPDVSWLVENAGETSHPVATKIPNRQGLYDTVGNVAEWCVGDDGRPVACGGSFRDSMDDIGNRLDARNWTAAIRQAPAWNATDPAFPKSKWWLRDAPFVGFRVVCEEGPP